MTWVMSEKREKVCALCSRATGMDRHRKTHNDKHVLMSGSKLREGHKSFDELGWGGLWRPL